MRDLLFKNLTSSDRRRKIISSSEIVDQQGVRSIIRRHFICFVKKVQGCNKINRPLPYLYVLKEHSNLERREKFLCRIKGSVYAVHHDNLYLILFMHSLKISLISIAQDVVKYNEENSM